MTQDPLVPFILDPAAAHLIEMQRSRLQSLYICKKRPLQIGTSRRLVVRVYVCVHRSLRQVGVGVADAASGGRDASIELRRPSDKL